MIGGTLLELLPVFVSESTEDWPNPYTEPTEDWLDKYAERLINCAHNEWEVWGTLTTHTYMALNEAGIDPDALIESFHNGGN